MTTPAKFLSGNLMRHITVMALSSTVGLFAIFIVDFVDLYFISLLGESALAAAVGYSGTLLFFSTALSIGLMIAMSALGANRIGKGEPDVARRLATNVLVIGFLMSAVVASLFWRYAPELLDLIGATGQTRAYAIDYLRIIVPSMPLLVMAMSCSGLLRAHGDARRAMNTTLASGFVNAIADPILIFGLGLGLDGAAYATVAARVTMAVMAVVPILRHYGGFAPFRGKAFFSDFLPIMSFAIPAMLTNVATPVGNFFVIREIAQFGDSAVAGYSVVGRLTPLVFGVLFALSGAIGPIIGQNFGAGNIARVRETILKAIVFTAICTLVGWLFLALTWSFFADQFNVSAQGRALIYTFSVIVAPLFFFNGVLFVTNAAFNNLNKPIWSTLFNWGRNTLGILPFVWIGANLAQAPGVLIGQALGGVVFAVFGVLVVLRLCSRYDQGGLDIEAPPQPSWHRERPDPPFNTPRG